jgi:hypothetical protein
VGGFSWQLNIKTLLEAAKESKVLTSVVASVLLGVTTQADVTLSEAAPCCFACLNLEI